MRLLTKLILAGSFILICQLNSFSQTIKIMPMGNSITYDDRVADGSNPRPAGDRPGYRWKLYDLLSAKGYNFDLVGSENSGENYFPDGDNAGFPGINDGQLAHLITTGYNQREGVYEENGPYLLYNSADIILLHIGTNDFEDDYRDVESVLNAIRAYDSDVFILVARILNHQYNNFPDITSFNNHVEAMVNARGDSRIKMVNIETGASINYSTDFADYLHPNQAGYDKIGEKWFEAIEAINPNAPVVNIPNQQISEGGIFSTIYLDNYVSDVEDNASDITWTFEPNPASNLNISISSNRIATVTLKDASWSGSETITFKATDSGSGAFKKSGSDEVTFSVGSVNDAPVINQTYPITINEENNYQITLTDLDWFDEDNTADEITLTVFEGDNYSLNGTTIKPDDDFYGNLTVNVKIADLELESTTESINVTVNNINDAPVILGQNATLSCEDESSIELLKSYFNISDVDNPPSTDITIEVVSGDNYSHNGNTVSPDAGFSGTLNINLRAYDKIEYSVNFQAQVDVTLTHNPPYFTTEPTKNINEDTYYQYFVGVDDPDSEDNLTLTAVDLPSWLYFNSSVKLLGGTPTNEDVGVHSVALRVNDGTFSIDQNFTITVNNVNDPPVFTSSPKRTADDYEPYAYPIIVSDEDVNDILTISLNTKPDWLTLRNDSLVGTPLWNDAGKSFNVEINVNDGHVDVTQSFSIIVGNENSKPVITSVPILTATENELYTYQLMGTDEDEDDDLIVVATSLPDWLELNQDEGTISGIPDDKDVGGNYINIGLNDSHITESQTFVITVANVNDTPVFVTEPILEVDELSLYYYKFEATDDDIDDQVNYTLGDHPNWLQFYEETRELGGQPKLEDVGTHKVSLYATDEKTHAVQTFTITVNKIEHEPEILSMPKDSATEDINYTYYFDTRDLDNNPIVQYAEYLPNWLEFDSISHILWGKPSDEDIGISQVKLCVTDGNSPVCQSFAINVKNVNDKPVIMGFDTVKTTKNTSVNIDLSNINVEDPDPDDSYPKNFSLIIENGNHYSFAGRTITPETDFIGNISVRLHVNDGIDDSESSFIVVNVSDETGINNLSLNKKLVSNVYPVPAKNTLHIDVNSTTKDKNIMIINSVGSIVEESLIVKGQSDYRVDVSNLQNGFYLIKIFDDENYYSGKFTVKH